MEYFLAFLCLTVYAGTLFFPLLDKDAAHHANIALHMYQTGDYTSLVDRGNDYLDKPHLLFWVSLLSFKIFGVTTLAHRLPALLFALLSVFSTYRLTLHLTDKTTARIAAILLGTAQAFVLSVADARMETPLTAGISFGLWHLILYASNARLLNLVLGALGVALAFTTKGWLGPVIVFMSLFFYLLLSRGWKILARPKTWLIIPIFFLFISPVLYAYYLQFDLHPEKVIRGRSDISGVKFILWGQLFERYRGFDEGGRYSDPFYLYHTFLWAYFPWCIAAYLAVVFWLRRMTYLKKWNHPVNFTVLAFVFVLGPLSFSRFKMPHYLIMLFPLVSIFTATYLRHILAFRRGRKILGPILVFFAILVLVIILYLNFILFSPVSWFVPVAAVLLTIPAYILYKASRRHGEAKLVYLGAFISLLFNFFLYYNFFPQLLTFQAGNELAKKIKQENIKIPDEQIRLIEPNAHSFDFYRRYCHPVVPLETLTKGEALPGEYYYLINRGQRDELKKAGFKVEAIVSSRDYNIAKVNLRFADPERRKNRMDTLMLARISR